MSGPFGSSPWGYNPGGNFYPHTIDQSLRFEDGDSAYLNRTPTSAGNRKTWTWSSWVKRGNISSFQGLFASRSALNDASYMYTAFITADNFQFASYSTVFAKTSQLFRDSSAWYHIVIAFDATAAAAADRLKIYVNGSEAALSTDNRSSISNQDYAFNQAGPHYISGRYVNSWGSGFDGYLAEINVIDGTALTPASFGETIGGVWVPKKYSGSYGTNGFYLPFAQDFTAGNSIFFSGTSDRVQHSDSTAYDIGASDDFTIEFFFKTSEVGTGHGHVMGDYATNGPHHLITYDFRNASTRKIRFYSNNGQALLWDISGDVTVSNNTWHHVVFQRDGTTLRAYVDGTRLTSVSNESSSWTLSDGKATNFNKSYNLSRIRLGNIYTTNPIIGSLSNVRYVIGNTVYADDDSNITVPTQTLTAVTGTKLLTAVNSTLGDDISTENNDATTSGSPALSSDSPFTTKNFFDDASGNGNDFTANNLTSGDVLLDSPTNNFATLNYLRRAGNPTLKEGGLEAQDSSSACGDSTFHIPQTGKWYFESMTAVGGGLRQGVGDYSAAFAVGTFLGVGGDTGCYQWQENTTGVSINNSTGSATGGGTSAFTSNPGVGTPVGVTVDVENLQIYFQADVGSGLEVLGPFSINSAHTNLSPAFNMVNDTVSFNFGADSSFAGRKTSGFAQAQDANGVGDFYYAPPAGALALCTSNLPEPTIGPNSTKQSDDYFNTVLYTGDGSTRSITGVGFQPDWSWLKARNGAGSGRQQMLFDSVRGATKVLRSNLTNVEVTVSTSLTSFNSDGFSLGSDSDVNTDSENFVAWNWKAGTAFSNDASATGIGTIDSSGQVNTTAGFSIVSYTGTTTTNTNTGIAHGLSQKPDLIIIKNRDWASSSKGWPVWSSPLSTEGAFLDNTDNSEANNFNYFFGAQPTSTIFNVRADTSVSTANRYRSFGRADNYIAYCFHSVDGYSKVGSYVGNGNADGTFVYTGFRPAFVLLKVASAANNWFIYDNRRDGYNEENDTLSPNLTAVEDNSYKLDLVSNGFKIRGSQNAHNQSAKTFIYLAFAESPFKYANAR